MKYFIADNNGDIYAHDIESEAKAILILEEIKEELVRNGESIPDGIEVLKDDGIYED